MLDLSPSRIRDLHRHVARLASEDPVFMPIFERMEVELMEAEASETEDPIIHARKLSEARRARIA